MSTTAIWARSPETRESYPSFRGARSANPESRDSGSGPSDHPGMTAIKFLAFRRTVSPPWRIAVQAPKVLPEGRKAGPLEGAHGGTAGDDPRPRAVLRHSYADHAA